MRKSSAIVFAHDPRDAVLVAITLVELVGRLTITVAWSALPLSVALLAIIGLSAFNCTNYICSAHSFLHLPFFTRRWLNRVWGVVASLALSMPVTLYKAQHLNHHRFGMDHSDATIGETRDRSSIYRYGPAPDRSEPVWRYALMALLRESPRALTAEARRRGEGGQLAAEATALAFAAVALAWIDLRGLLFVCLPAVYLGQVLSRIEAYSEHFGATPGDRRTDSVSCYGRLYNLLWFNNGYHQEHHFNPGVHWTRLPTLSAQMLPQSERRIVTGAHFINIFSGPLRRFMGELY
jgi:fatty acid desaturase